jgi:hypothetical protein
MRLTIRRKPLLRRRPDASRVGIGRAETCRNGRSALSSRS